MNGYNVTYVGDTPCYLAGSMILTSNGDVAVENLIAGDEVIAFDWKNQIGTIRKIVWVGYEHIMVNSVLPGDISGYPVRVLKDAISSGVPDRNLLITAEHYLFFDNKFVAVRMLVNGHNISYDLSINHFDIYHVETESHTVLIANNVFSESFLNISNHSVFKKTIMSFLLRKKHGTVMQPLNYAHNTIL